jgi:hypothetical protein
MEIEPSSDSTTKQHQSSEEIIGRITSVDLPGLTDKYYNLLFTNKRIIGEFIGGNGAAFLLGGLIGASIAQSYHKGKAKSMKESTPDQIISSNKRNFLINYDDVEYIKLSKKTMQVYLKEKQYYVGKKPKFYFSKKQKSEIEAILMNIIPNKINRR